MSNHPYRSVDLIALREELEAEIKQLAAEGDITGCDIRHSQIADIESVIQLFEDRAGAQIDAEINDEIRRGL